MLANPILLIFVLFNGARGQLSFDFIQSPITDTVKFNHEYDFIVIGAGSGCFFLCLGGSETL